MPTTTVLATWIGLPLLGGVIGYVTNRIAVKMIFRPIEPKRVLGIRVQEKGVGGGRALVRARDDGVRRAHGDARAIIGVAGERVQQGDVEVLRVARHARSDVGE